LEKEEKKDKRELTYKVYTDGRNVTLSICLISESEQQTTLAYSGIANKQQLEQIIAVGKR
jgi:hypothetical protein